MPKSYGRNERIGASILREVAQVLAKDIKDPRVSLATVTEVSVSPDLRNATIYVSFLNDNDEQVKEAMKALDKAKGFVRSTLAARLKMRYMPNIHFRFDSLIKESMRPLTALRTPQTPPTLLTQLRPQPMLLRQLPRPRLRLSLQRGRVAVHSAASS